MKNKMNDNEPKSRNRVWFKKNRKTWKS